MRYLYKKNNSNIEEYAINKKTRRTPRKGMGWCGIWGVDIIPWYGMVLRLYHLIFMG